MVFGMHGCFRFRYVYFPQKRGMLGCLFLDGFGLGHIEERLRPVVRSFLYLGVDTQE